MVSNQVLLHGPLRPAVWYTGRMGREDARDMILRCS